MMLHARYDDFSKVDGVWLPGSIVAEAANGRGDALDRRPGIRAESADRRRHLHDPAPMSAFVEWLDWWRRAIPSRDGPVARRLRSVDHRREIEMDLLAQLPSGSSVFRDYRDVLQRFGTTDRLMLLVAGPPDALPTFGEDLAGRLTVLPGIISAAPESTSNRSAVTGSFPHR